jgi:hypothetical protein
METHSWSTAVAPASKRQRAALHKFFGLYSSSPELVAQFDADDANTMIAIFARHAASAKKETANQLPSLVHSGAD